MSAQAVCEGIMEYPAKAQATVLIVDDDAGFSLMLSNVLGRLGYNVLTTLSASNVPIYDLMARDVIFIDIVMPVMNGLDVLRSLAKHKSTCSVILMSGSQSRLDDAEKLAKGLDLKIIGVLSKPFRLDDVKEALARG